MANQHVTTYVDDINQDRVANYERLVERRRERERARKRDARKRQTPEQLERARILKRAARKRQTPEQLEHEKERLGRRCRRTLRPFWGIDGEGGGTDALGRQYYLLMVASGQVSGEENIIHRAGGPLSTRDCLDFILSLPPEPRLVGYGTGYDATQILRGISNVSTLRQILNPPQGKNGPCYTFWGGYLMPPLIPDR
jgi:hypothetical protein